MGFFDFFMSSEKKAQQQKQAQHEQQQALRPAEKETYNYSNTSSDGSVPNSAIQVFYPTSFDEISSIIDLLSIGKPAIVNIKELTDATSQRVLDLLSGAIYALHGGLCEVDKGIYLFSTDGVKIK